MRLIDADTIPYTMLYKENWLKGTGQEKQGVWKDDIDKMPTIEPKRGRWIADEHKPLKEMCSVCGFARFQSRIKNFCPNCGARMEE